MLKLLWNDQKAGWFGHHGPFDVGEWDQPHPFSRLGKVNRWTLSYGVVCLASLSLLSSVPNLVTAYFSAVVYCRKPQKNKQRQAWVPLSKVRLNWVPTEARLWDETLENPTFRIQSLLTDEIGARRADRKARKQWQIQTTLLIIEWLFLRAVILPPFPARLV